MNRGEDEEFEKLYQTFIRRYPPIAGKTWAREGWNAAWKYLTGQVAEQVDMNATFMFGMETHEEAGHERT